MHAMTGVHDAPHATPSLSLPVRCRHSPSASPLYPSEGEVRSPLFALSTIRYSFPSPASTPFSSLRIPLVASSVPICPLLPSAALSCLSYASGAIHVALPRHSFPFSPLRSMKTALSTLSTRFTPFSAIPYPSKYVPVMFQGKM